MYVLASVCLQKNIPCVGLTVQAIKKFMTGKGNATKDEMIVSAKSKGFNPKTDDEADAIGVMLLASNILTLNNKFLDKNNLGSLSEPVGERMGTPRNLSSDRNFS